MIIICFNFPHGLQDQVTLCSLQAFNCKSFLYCVCDDILQRLWCASVLANFAFLLDCAIHCHNEKANNSHDKIQICPFYIRETGTSQPSIAGHWTSVMTVSNNSLRSLDSVTQGKRCLRPMIWTLPTNFLWNNHCYAFIQVCAYFLVIDLKKSPGSQLWMHLPHPFCNIKSLLIVCSVHFLEILICWDYS